uniref:DNA replication licensing factor MCM7 n=1 Tax=Ogataea thermomethanolica (nom. inval.) TaxID=310468 RepID=A0A5P8D3T7_9ASCO|nr:DNA replication licensing factor MCM7 [Ogataea thermomethanolica (nom. inval.)]QGW56832.1 DNA replication licensing factor MCM7 [Ogataea thermomethanolica (nom. inval.)]
MAGAYTILGKAVPPHHLAIATIASVVALVAPKPWTPKVKLEPKIESSSPEEAQFVKEYLEKHN